MIEGALKMRRPILVLFAAAMIAGPAVAQTDNVAATNDMAAPDANMATNADDATLNGMTADPNLVMPLPPVTEDPVADTAMVPDSDDGGGFPWGLLGILGLIGLVGRFRS